MTDTSLFPQAIFNRIFDPETNSIRVTGDGITENEANALYLRQDNNLSDLDSVSTARTNLGLTAGGAGDIWVEKAGDTMSGDLRIVAGAERYVYIKHTGLTDSPQFGLGDITIGGDGDAHIRITYTDDLIAERNVVEIDNKGIVASVKPTVGSHFEGFIDGDTYPLFRLNSYNGSGNGMTLEFGGGGDSNDTDILIRREDANTLTILTGATPVERLSLSNTETVFNESGADIDFRVESDTFSNALIVDGGTGAVGINRAVVANRALAIGGRTDGYGEFNLVVAGDNSGAFKAYKEGESSQRFEFTNQGDLKWGGGSGSPDTTLIRRAPNRNQFFGDVWFGPYDGQTVKVNGVTGFIALKDGITAPGTDAGFAQIYVDSADGDLKVKFADGFVAVLAADS